MFSPTTDSPALGRLFLARLERSTGLARRTDVAALPQWLRQARHAAFSAYRDCLALGLEREARAALDRSDRPAVGVG
jgi:hypothetical protein